MKKILITLFSFLLFFQLFGQNKIADALFENFEYKLAIQYYNSPVEVVNTNFEIETLNLESRIRLALCYYRIHDFKNAEIELQKLIEIEDIDPIFYHYYAICLKNNKKYKQAKKYFIKTQKIDSTHFYNNLYLKSLDSLILWDSNIVDIKVEEVSDLNSSLADFSPQYYKNGILFCSEQIHDSLSKRKHIDFNPIFENIENAAQRIVIAAKIQNELTYGSDLSPRTSLVYSTVNYSKLFNIESLYNIPKDAIGKTEIIAENKKINIGSYYYDSLNNELFYTNSINTNSWTPDVNEHSILYSAKLNSEKNKLIKKKRTKIKRLSLRFGSGDPSITSDGNIMYFVSDKSKGYGGTDIYFVYTNNGQVMSAPINLVPRIYSSGHELAPYIFENCFYFAFLVFFVFAVVYI